MIPFKDNNNKEQLSLIDNQPLIIEIVEEEVAQYSSIKSKST
jgi:hypothetical protein